MNELREYGMDIRKVVVPARIRSRENHEITAPHGLPDAGYRCLDCAEPGAHRLLTWTRGQFARQAGERTGARNGEPGTAPASGPFSAGNLPPPVHGRNPMKLPGQGVRHLDTLAADPVILRAIFLPVVPVHAPTRPPAGSSHAYACPARSNRGDHPTTGPGTAAPPAARWRVERRSRARAPLRNVGAVRAAASRIASPRPPRRRRAAPGVEADAVGWIHGAYVRETDEA